MGEHCFLALVLVRLSSTHLLATHRLQVEFISRRLEASTLMPGKCRREEVDYRAEQQASIVKALGAALLCRV